MIRRILTSVAAALVAAVAGIFTWRFVMQRVRARNAREVVGPGGVSEADTIRIGAAPQVVTVEAADTSKPVLLIVHGGPGLPLPGVANRGVSYDATPGPATDRLARHFTVVHWDQRGAGRSYEGVTGRSLTIEQVVQDTVSVIDQMRLRYRQDKVYLLGSSWGTVPAILTAARYPELVHAYIGCGQIVDWTASDRVAYGVCLERATVEGREDVLRELEEMGPPPYLTVDGWTPLRGAMMELGLYSVEDEDGVKPNFTEALYTFFTSPDYSVLDLVKLPFGFKYSLESLLPEINELDIAEAVPALAVPAYFFHGRYDYAATASLLEEFVQALDAPSGKQLMVLEDSAHLFSRAAAERVQEELIEMVETA